MRAKLEDTLEVTRKIIRGFFQGDVEPWFSYLCARSVWVGPGQRTISGGDAIREYFKGENRMRDLQIFREEYDVFPVNARCSAVAAHIEAGKQKAVSAQMKSEAKRS